MAKIERQVDFEKSLRSSGDNQVRNELSQGRKLSDIKLHCVFCNQSFQ